jgi:hypothetical protein
MGDTVVTNVSTLIRLERSREDSLNAVGTNSIVFPTPPSCLMRSRSTLLRNMQCGRTRSNRSLRRMVRAACSIEWKYQTLKSDIAPFSTRSASAASRAGGSAVAMPIARFDPDGIELTAWSGVVSLDR